MKSLTFEVPRPLSSAPITSVISLTPGSVESTSPEKLAPRPKDVESEREDRASPTSNLPVPSSSLCLFPSSDPMRLSTLPPPLFFCSRRTLRSNASASSSTTMASSPSIARNLLPAVGAESGWAAGVHGEILRRCNCRHVFRINSSPHVSTPHSHMKKLNFLFAFLIVKRFFKILVR